MARVGTIGEVLSFEQRSENGVQWAEVKVDLGGENIVTADYYPPPGFEAWPLPGDFAFLADGPGSGNWICTGFRDPKLDPVVTAKGEVAFYSRSAPGVVASKVILKTDGSIDWNDGAVVLGADGVLTIDADAVAAGVSVSGHTHGYIDSVGDPPVTTPSETDPPS